MVRGDEGHHGGVDLSDLHSRTDLMAVTGPDDAFARLDPAAEATGWAYGQAVSFLRTSAARPPSLFSWGPDVGALLDALVGSGIMASFGVAGVSVPWPDRAEIDARFTVTGGGDWDWMWTTRHSGPNHRLQSGRLVELDDTRDAAEITELAAENPRFEGFPGTGHNELWLGARDDDGTLIACGAVQRLPAGTAHLGGILVASRHRRRGLGTTISAALTDRMVEAEGVCTLGMYSDNDAARSVYHRLGYVTDKAWASRSIRPVGGAPAEGSVWLGCSS